MTSNEDIFSYDVQLCKSLHSNMCFDIRQLLQAQQEGRDFQNRSRTRACEDSVWLSAHRGLSIG